MGRGEKFEISGEKRKNETLVPEMVKWYIKDLKLKENAYVFWTWMDEGWWLEVCGLRSAVCGLRSAVCGLRTAVVGTYIRPVGEGQEVSRKLVKRLQV